MKKVSLLLLSLFMFLFVGCGAGAKMTGFNGREALQIGFGMIPRAEVAIIIANLGLKMEVIDNHIMASVILMVLVTTLVTPSLLKWSFSEPKKEAHAVT